MSFAEGAGFKPDAEAESTAVEASLKLKWGRPRAWRLEYLLAQVAPGNRHSEADFGAPWVAKNGRQYVSGGSMTEELPERIEINPDVMSGKAVIRGTRTTVEILLSDYPRLSREDVLAAIAHYRSANSRLIAGS